MRVAGPEPGGLGVDFVGNRPLDSVPALSGRVFAAVSGVVSGAEAVKTENFITFRPLL
jgi:hypothetical protein